LAKTTQIEKRPHRVTISLTEAQYNDLLTQARDRFPITLSQVAYERYTRRTAKSRKPKARQ